MVSKETDPSIDLRRLEASGLKRPALICLGGGGTAGAPTAAALIEVGRGIELGRGVAPPGALRFQTNDPMMSRRHAEVRQGKPEGIRAYRFDGWELNLNMRRLTSRDGRHVALSNGEFSLLVVLLGAPNRILSRDQLLDLSRLHNDEVFNRSVDVQIMRLRRKIEVDPAQPRYIRTERGAGYLFGVPVDTVY